MKSPTILHPIEQFSVDAVTELRKKNKITQQRLSEIIGTTPAFIGNVENKKNLAKYNLSHLNVIADFFNVSPQEFLPQFALK